MKKQTSRFLAAFLTLLMLFSPLSIAVSALSVGETVKVSGASEWISGFYYNFSKSGFGTNKHGQHQHLHANDGRPAYCVEPNEHFTNGNKTIQKTFASLSQDTQKRITAALLYGFDGNTKYGYSWQTEYVATQGIIWTLVQGYFNTAQEDAFLNCAFGGNTSASNRAACKAVYGNIKDQILSHYTVPSFSASNPTWVSKITLKYNSASGRYEGSVFDNGLSLFNFAMPDDFKNLEEYAKTRSNPYRISYEEICKEVMGAKQKSQLRRLIGFKFKRHPSLNLPEERLAAIEKQVNERVRELLALPSRRKTKQKDEPTR